MFPFPARVIFPAVVSIVSALWALAEWRRGDDLMVADLPPVDDAEREAAERRRVAAEDRAERALRLSESREARLARRDGPAPDPAA